MATPGRSQALREVSQYLGVRGSVRALRLEERAYRSLFGRYGRDNWRYWAISPSRDMLAIRLAWGRDDVLENLRIAMLLEAVGQGPQRYCICFDDSDEDFSDDHPEYYRRLQLVLMHYHRSVCSYIQQVVLSEDHFCMSHGCPEPGPFSLVLRSLMRSLQRVLFLVEVYLVRLLRTYL